MTISVLFFLLNQLFITIHDNLTYLNIQYVSFILVYQRNDCKGNKKKKIQVSTLTLCPLAYNEVNSKISQQQKRSYWVFKDVFYRPYLSTYEFHANFSVHPGLEMCLSCMTKMRFYFGLRSGVLMGHATFHQT